MRVLLISENRVRENLVPYPLGTSYIAAAARDTGHEVAGLDLMFSPDPLLEVSESIRRFRPDCIGLSIRNIDNQDVYNVEFFLPAVRDIVEGIKSVTGAPVILGGAGFTIFPLECLEYFDLEMGIVGEGEVSFTRLLECLASGSDPRNLPGLALRRNGKGMVNPPGPSPDFKRMPPPDRNTFDVGPYNWTPGSDPPFVANLQARRGCHMRCIYCTNPLVEGRNIRLREPEAVADELQSLECDHGIKIATFTDSLFNYPDDYSIELCREIARRRLSIKWTCTFTPMNPDPELFGLMSEAGCFFISLGNESGSEDMLTALRKGFSKKEILESVREAKQAGLMLNCFLLLGGPGENRRTVEESVEFVSELEPNAVTVTVGIRIYPGCELYDIALREKVITPEHNLLYPAFYIAPEVEPWLYEYMQDVCGEREGWTM
jgi:radical SAM superfamily enzyme YgiQ (UPF0313 family)